MGPDLRRVIVCCTVSGTPGQCIWETRAEAGHASKTAREFVLSGYESESLDGESFKGMRAPNAAQRLLGLIRAGTGLP